MRTYQVTHCEGERLGDIDWSHDFFQSYSCYCTNDARKAEMMGRAIENLWQVERLHKKGVRLRITEGQFSHELLDVGMYDGWPYWKPMPAIFIRTVLGGGEWRHFPCVDEFEILDRKCPQCGFNYDRKPGEHWVLLDGGKRVCTHPWHNPKGFERR